MIIKKLSYVFNRNNTLIIHGRMSSLRKILMTFKRKTVVEKERSKRPKSIDQLMVESNFVPET